MRFEFGDELLGVGVGAELLQIRVGHQAVGIFVPAIDGFRQIPQRVIGVVGSQLSCQNTLSLTN
jgi:hypothetical protein